MKTIRKALYLLLALTLVFSFAACGGESAASTGGEEEDDNGGAGGEPKGETKTWGIYTVLVPEGFTLTGGGFGNTEDPERFTLTDKNDATKYVMFSLANNEEAAEANLGYTRMGNEESNPEDVTLSAGAEWKGVAYKYSGSVDCFQMYAILNERAVMVQGAYFAYDSAEVKAILSSLTVEAPAES